MRAPVNFVPTLHIWPKTAVFEKKVQAPPFRGL